MERQLNSEIFREYDIRGLVESEITPHLAKLIGKSIVQYLCMEGETRGSIVVGHDHRLSSPELADAVIDGIRSTGWDVIFVKTVPTPAYYYALHAFQARGGVMITASHNPPEFNGFKINQGFNSLYGAQIKKIQEIAQTDNFPEGCGSLKLKPILDQYCQDIVTRVSLSRQLKIVVDAGNGTAGLIAPELLTKLGCEVIPLYCEPDGTFPNHHPDPTVMANLTDLIDAVRKHKADLGIGYDGDSDRIGVVDEAGRVIWGDRLLALYAMDLLKRHNGATIIYEVKCSMALEEIIRKAGGKPIMYRAGHSLIKKKMKEENALLAGEMSGHMFFAENYFGFDDALYASAKLAQILSQQEKTFSEIMNDIPLYPSTPEIRVPCPEYKKKMIVNNVKETFNKQYPIIDVDGVRVPIENGWGLLRMSNTQPILVLRFEAKSDTGLHKIITIFIDVLSEYGLDLIPLHNLLS